MTHKLYINVYFIYFLFHFPSDSADISAYSDPRRPSRGLNLEPRLAVVGGVLLAILTDRSSRKQKYLDYDYMLPPMELNHRKGHAGRRMG